MRFRLRPRRHGRRAAVVAAVLALATVFGPAAAWVLAATSVTVPPGGATAVAGDVAPSIMGNNACSSYAFGSVIFSGGSWAAGMGHLISNDGATLDVRSNWNGVSCWRDFQGSDGLNVWGEQFQCTELAVRAADLQWNEPPAAWGDAGWNGNAYNMFDVAARLPVPLLPVGNGSGSLPNPGDIMVWGNTSSDPTGHVAVVERIDTAAQRVWVVSQNSFFAEYGLPYSGSTVDPGNTFGLPLRGWIDDPRPSRGVALRIDGRSGYALDGWGGVIPFGGAPPVDIAGYWPGWDIARGIALRSDGASGYVLDGWGGIHSFGGAPPAGDSAYWPQWDIARGIALRSDGVSGYVLDGWGGIHSFGGAPQVYDSAYWPGWDTARAIVLRPDGVSGYVLDGWGGIHTFGAAPPVFDSAYWPGWDIARGIVLAGDGRNAALPLDSGWVLDGWGGTHSFGDAPPVVFPQSPYFPGHDTARAIAYQPLLNAGVTVNGPSAPAAFHVDVGPGRGVALRPSGGGGYVLDGWGGVNAIGGAPSLGLVVAPVWPEWDISRGIVLRSDGSSGYFIDGWAGIHPFGGALPVFGSGYWPNQDVARGVVLRSDGASGYVLKSDGSLWPFGGAPAVHVSKTWGSDVARAVLLNSAGTGGEVLDAYGALHPFGSATLSTPALWPGWDIARGAVLLTDTSGYILDGWGGLHPFGGAPSITASSYWPGYDVARGIALTPGSTAENVSGEIVYVDRSTSAVSLG